MQVEAGREKESLYGVEFGLYTDLTREYWLPKPTQGQLYENLGSDPLRRTREARCSKCPNQRAHVQDLICNQSLRDGALAVTAGPTSKIYIYPSEPAAFLQTCHKGLAHKSVRGLMYRDHRVMCEESYFGICINRHNSFATFGCSK